MIRRRNFLPTPPSPPTRKVSAPLDWRPRKFTLDRVDFPRIPNRTWALVQRLRDQMVADYGIDESRANRELRLLVEVIDDTIAAAAVNAAVATATKGTS